MMEKIKINSIEKKGVVCIVKYNLIREDGHPGCSSEATLNINFNSQEISYLENDVGIGGVVSVEITNKEKVKGNVSAGYWVNITKVDFDSAVPSGQVLKEVQNGERSLNGQEQKPKDSKTFATGYETFKSNSIIAQCLVKAVISQTDARDNPVTIKEAVNMYKEALELLG